MKQVLHIVQRILVEHRHGSWIGSFKIFLQIKQITSSGVKGRLSDGIFGPFFQFLRGQNHAILIWP